VFRFAPDDLIEAPQQLFALRVRSGLVRARLDARLRLLADPPILAIRQIPEFNRIVGLKVRFRELGRMEVHSQMISVRLWARGQSVCVIT